MKKESTYETSRANVIRSGRTIYFFDNVDESSAMEAIKYLAVLQSESKTKPINFVINSMGGNCTDGFALYDYMRACTAPITTIGMGMVASMGLIIFLAGDKRIGSPNVKFLNHQPWGGAEGKASDIQIEAHEIEKTKATMINLVAERTKMSKAEIKKGIKEGDNYFDAPQALDKGIIHQIFSYVDKTSFKDNATTVDDK